MAGCLSATLLANVRIFSVFPLGNDIVLVKDKLGRIVWLTLLLIKYDKC